MGSEETEEAVAVQLVEVVEVGTVVEDIVPTTSLEARTSWSAGGWAALASPRAKERLSAGQTG